MQDRSPPLVKIFLLRTAGPYIRVKVRRSGLSAASPFIPQCQTLTDVGRTTASGQEQT